MINEYGKPTTPFKLESGTKPSILHLNVLFCLCVVQNDTAHVGTKALNMCHQAQKGFRCIFIGNPQHRNGYLVYAPNKRKIVSLYDVVFDDIVSSPLAHVTTIFRSNVYATGSVIHTI